VLQAKFKSDALEYKTIQEQSEAKKDKEDKSVHSATHRDRNKERQQQERIFKSCKKMIEKIINDLTKDFVHQRPSEFFRQ